MNNVSTKQSASKSEPPDSGVHRIAAPVEGVEFVDDPRRLYHWDRQRAVAEEVVQYLHELRKSFMEMWAADDDDSRNAILHDVTQTLGNADLVAQDLIYFADKHIKFIDEHPELLPVERKAIQEERVERSKRGSR